MDRIEGAFDRADALIDGVDDAVSKVSKNDADTLISSEDVQTICSAIDAAIEALWFAFAELPLAVSPSPAVQPSIWTVPEYPPQVRSPIEQRDLGDLIRQMDEYARGDEDFRDALRTLVGLTPTGARRLSWTPSRIGVREIGKGITPQWCLEFYPQQHSGIWADLEPSTVPSGAIVLILKGIAEAGRRLAGVP